MKKTMTRKDKITYEKEERKNDAALRFILDLKFEIVKLNMESSNKEREFEQR
jgi:hypothetical protein